jgi:hypothetical protein
MDQPQIAGAGGMSDEKWSPYECGNQGYTMANAVCDFFRLRLFPLWPRQIIIKVLHDIVADFLIYQLLVSPAASCAASTSAAILISP